MGLLGMAVLSALLPDLDHPRAALAPLRLDRSDPVMRHIRPLAPVALGIRLGIGHRGPLHALVAAAYLAALLLGTGPGMALGWGYATRGGTI